ncbi:MAG: hypothetical protein JNK05_30385 [Myxococcales bacterium]|nr:hypothetical protein [Myxococcales bacterium]
MSRALRVALVVDAVLVGIFGVSSGLYKAFGGEADVRLYGAAGVGATAMAAIGVAQAIAGVGLFAGLRAQRWLAPSAAALAVINLGASWVLYRNGVQPFATISLLFVAMALAPLARRADAR